MLRAILAFIVGTAVWVLVASLLNRGLRLALGGLPFDTLETRPVEFRCKCSYDRVLNIVTALGREEVEDMLEKDKGAELTCHFCNSVYYLDEDALRGILEPPPPVVM